MFANFLDLFGRKPDGYDRAFVKDVVVQPRSARSRRVERLLAIGWILIALKSVAVWWACRKYAVPIHPLWVIGPTVFMGLLCTAIYWRRK
jgi:hypothetical protein